MGRKKSSSGARKESQDAKWEAENASVQDFWAKADRVKAHVRAQGCNLPFFDFLDSYEEEFRRVVAWAKNTFPSLHGVFEVSAELLADDAGYQHLRLPADWKKIWFNASRPSAAT